MRRRPGRGGAVLALASALALGAAFPATLRIPPRDPAAPRSVPAAWFSHRAHQSFGCFACHPSMFPQAPLGFTHEEMRAGRFCGQLPRRRDRLRDRGRGVRRCHAPLGDRDADRGLLAALRGSCAGVGATARRRRAPRTPGRDAQRPRRRSAAVARRARPRKKKRPRPCARQRASSAERPAPRRARAQPRGTPDSSATPAAAPADRARAGTASPAAAPSFRRAVHPVADGDLRPATARAGRRPRRAL